jgi:hypothetical protein
VDADAADKFLPVNEKAARRRDRAAQFRAEREAKYGPLYKKGMSDKEVRALLAQVRDDVVAALPSNPMDRFRIPKTKAPAAAASGSAESSDNRKRGFVPGTPTGFTPQEKQQRQSGTTPLPGGPPKSWAEVTARHAARRKVAPPKPKEDFPYMLEVYSGVDTRASVPQDLFVPFRKALMAEVFVNLAKPKEDRIPLKIGFTQWSQAKQAILIACQDDISQGWCRAQVDGITLEPDLRFRAWDPITEPRYRPVRVTVGDLDITPAQALDLAKGCNDDIMGEIVLLKDSFVPSRRGGLQVIFGVDDLAAASLFLKDVPLRLYLGLDERQAPYAGLSSLITRLAKEDYQDLAAQLVQRSRDPTLRATFDEAEASVDPDDGAEGSSTATAAV